MYRFFYWLVLSRLPAEGVHVVAFWALRLVMTIPGLASLCRRLCLVPGTEVHALGLRFPSPVGLAAGFDKDALGFEALGALGFGFVEIGTVTGQAQPGNPKPRMFRLPLDKALINRMGFNNEGSLQAAKRLAKRKPGGVIVGANIGKTKLVSVEDATADYVQSAERLALFCDYMVVNVSSPNTPGLRNLQAVTELRPLLTAVQETLRATCPERHVPLLVKIAPDLADTDIDAVADLVKELDLDGVIATNTTIARETLALKTPSANVMAIGSGGLSGRPLKERSLEVCKRLRARLGNGPTIVSVGGIETAEDAKARLDAGATLVQAYTGFVYNGPFWVRRLNKSLADLASQQQPGA